MAMFLAPPCGRTSVVGLCRVEDLQLNSQILCVFHAALSSGGFAGDVNALDAFLPFPNYFSDFHI